MLAVDQLLLPGLKKVARPAGSRVVRGLFALGAMPLRYSFVLNSSGGQIGDVSVTADNAVTGQPVTVGFVDALSEPAQGVSLHPWDLPKRMEQRELVLGPGEVEIAERTMFGPETSVVVMPGTTLRLGPGVSMEFRGMVTAIGTEEKPTKSPSQRS